MHHSAHTQSIRTQNLKQVLGAAKNIRFPMACPVTESTRQPITASPWPRGSQSAPLYDHDVQRVDLRLWGITTHTHTHTRPYLEDPSNAHSGVLIWGKTSPAHHLLIHYFCLPLFSICVFWSLHMCPSRSIVFHGWFVLPSHASVGHSSSVSLCLFAT